MEKEKSSSLFVVVVVVCVIQYFCAALRVKKFAAGKQVEKQRDWIGEEGDKPRRINRVACTSDGK